MMKFVVNEKYILAVSGFLLFVMGLWTSVGINQVTTPVNSDYYVVHQVFVPDHEEGVDPLVVYDRTILRNFSATWVAEIQVVTPDRKEPVCSGSATSNYDTEETLPDDITLSWYVGKECDLSVGHYVIYTTWNFINEDLEPLTNTSNVFRVTPRIRS